MCLYLYIHNKYTQYTHILCKQKLLFWMRLITINHLTAQIHIYIHTHTHTHTHTNTHTHTHAHTHTHTHTFFINLPFLFGFKSGSGSFDRNDVWAPQKIECIEDKCRSFQFIEFVLHIGSNFVLWFGSIHWLFIELNFYIALSRHTKAHGRRNVSQPLSPVFLSHSIIHCVEQSTKKLAENHQPATPGITLSWPASHEWWHILLKGFRRERHSFQNTNCSIHHPSRFPELNGHG